MQEMMSGNLLKIANFQLNYNFACLCLPGMIAIDLVVDDDTQEEFGLLIIGILFFQIIIEFKLDSKT